MEDLYKVLGVPVNAPAAQIKARYRLLALSVHPDRNLPSSNAELFHAYQQAYKVLIDPKKRSDYNKKRGIIIKPRPLKLGYDLHQRLAVSGEQALQGALVPFTFTRYEPCSLCWCEGCSACSHTGMRPEEARVEVKIPAGLEHSLTVWLEGSGVRSDPGGTRGDLFVYVYVETEKSNT